ncbi:hypothetical protein M011DRAFT_510383 [Sporormia fimetaria CBS 119925]|uniref:F-box domain-containing protein n=1 Tax=Sporormia fimetaria CBS 119925 TaxID=1340428 RepID=A0A6A6UZ49_9PLEO|nr:hypothetical protein M011DRAFT_510383 [Sporormia fimetaria CBS 119925]
MPATMTTHLSRLETLPLELQQQITSYLRRRDLFAFRNASHACERIADRQFAHLAIARLNSGVIVVFNTSTEVRLLLGLCQIPSILPLIKRIHVVSCRQFIRRPRGIRIEMLQFEMSATAKDLWTEVLKLLKRSAAFQTMVIGTEVKSNSINSSHVELGAKEIRAMWHGPTCGNGTQRGPDIEEGITFRHLYASVSGLLTAIAEAKLDLYTVIIKISPTQKLGIAAYYDYVEGPRWTGWEQVARQCISFVRVSNLDLSVGVTERKMDVGWMTECFGLATKARKLKVNGFAGSWHSMRHEGSRKTCEQCSGLFRALTPHR